MKVSKRIEAVARKLNELDRSEPRLSWESLHEDGRNALRRWAVALVEAYEAATGE